MFKFLKKDKLADEQTKIFRTLTATGVLVSTERHDSGRKVDGGLLNGYSAQLLDEELAIEVPGGVALSWESLYAAIGQVNFNGLPEALELPPFTDARIALRSNGVTSFEILGSPGR